MNKKENNIQLHKDGSLRHFLTIEGLSKDLLLQILDTAESFASLPGRLVKKVPALRGRVITNLFFENSTRTRTTFELAAKRLSADVLNFDVKTSATSKGESLLDTLRNIEAMHSEMFVVRHNQSGAAHFIAEHASEGVSVINAGDGRHAHPTQAMLDMPAAVDDAICNLSREVAEAVMDGYLFDVTNGATHYHAYYVKPSWSEKFTRTVRINDHIFYRWEF